MIILQSARQSLTQDIQMLACIIICILTLIIDMIEVAILLGTAMACMVVVVFAVSSLTERITQKTPNQPIDGDPQPLEF
jgi:tetrahydromethanopterin S-methyltransferase subunit E